MDARDLYGLALDRFIPERAALAKTLRGAGDRAEAARVAKLAKPSVAAWAVNQLVRTQRREVASLFDAGDALQRAQRDVMGGRGSAQALRTAAERERAAVTALTQIAGGLLTSDGHSLTATTLERISDTLHAAALDTEARTEMQDGCLLRELRHIGLGAGAMTEMADAPGAATRPAAAPSAARGRAGRASRAPQEQREADAGRVKRDEGRRRAKRLDAAQKAVAAARKAAERAQNEVQSMQQRRDRAEDALRQADDALTAAQQRATDAARGLTDAEQALTEL